MWSLLGPLRMYFEPFGRDLFLMLNLAPRPVTGGVFGSFTQRVLVPFFGVLVVGSTPSNTYQPFEVAFRDFAAEAAGTATPTDVAVASATTRARFMLPPRLLLWGTRST